MNDINPINPAIETPLLSPEQQNMLLGILIAVMIMAAWMVIRRYLRRRKQKQPQKPTPPPRDYEAEALGKLKETKQHIEAGELKEFYLALTGVIKTYLTDKYQTQIVEMTTTELMQEKRVPDLVREKLRVILTTVDEAKFAQEHDQKKEAEDLYEAVRRLLIAMKP